MPYKTMFNVNLAQMPKALVENWLSVAKSEILEDEGKLPDLRAQIEAVEKNIEKNRQAVALIEAFLSGKPLPVSETDSLVSGEQYNKSWSLLDRTRFVIEHPEIYGIIYGPGDAVKALQTHEPDLPATIYKSVAPAMSDLVLKYKKAFRVKNPDAMPGRKTAYVSALTLDENKEFKPEYKEMYKGYVIAE